MKQREYYPYINLKSALNKAKNVYDADHSGRPMSHATICEVLGYSPKSSGANRTISTLKSYGLFTISGSGEERKIGVSSEALRYFKDERENIRKDLLIEFATKPRVFAHLWDEWENKPPIDSVARSYLKNELSYSEEVAQLLLDIYKKNISFVGFTGDKEINIDSASEDDVENERQSQEQTQMSAGTFATPNLNPAQAVESFVPEKMRKAMFPVDEGDVTLIFPADMSKESFEELNDYLQIFLKKQQRVAMSDDE